jgi:hypothetical protein
MIWDGMLEDARYGYLVFKEQNTLPQTGNSGAGKLSIYRLSPKTQALFQTC